MRDLKFYVLATFSTLVVVTTGIQNADSKEDTFVTFILANENDELYLKLAFEALVMNNPLQALLWLDKVDQKDPQVVAGRTFAAFSLDSWTETIDFFKKLEKPYKSLDGYQGITIEALTALGKISEAETMLQALLKMPPEPSMNQFPDYFQVFKREKLDQWNRNYVAAQFYKLVKHDLARSLKFFERIENPTLEVQIEKAEVLLAQGNLYEAKAVLSDVLSQSKNKQDKVILLRLLPLFAEIEERHGFYPEAFASYHQYFAEEGAINRYRIPYAKVLASLKRCDLAIDQFRLFMKSDDLSNIGMISYIKCLVHADKFDEANAVSRDWIAKGDVPLYYQIQLARLMVITQYADLLETLLDAIGGKEVRTLEENEQLILLWMDLGRYADAQSLATILQRSLEGSPKGLILLAQLSARLSRNEEALNYAEMASQIAPSEPQIADFFDTFQRTPDTIARSVKLVLERLELEPTSVTLQLQYAKDLIDLAVEGSSSNESAELETPDLQTAKSILEKLSRSNPEIPELFFLLGKVNYLLDKDKEAILAFEHALKLNPSYADSYQHLALLYEDKDLEAAVKLIKNAAKFEPFDPKIWLQLSDLLIKQKKYGEAIAALENAKKYAPNDSDPYKKMASVYLVLKNPEFAVANLEHALQLDPKDIEAIKLMLMALYDNAFQKADKEELEKIRLRYFDKLQALDPEEAAALRQRLGLKSE